jgi:T5orf172 domain
MACINNDREILKTTPILRNILNLGMTKAEMIFEYKRVKSILGKQPSKTQFFNLAKVSVRSLDKIYFENAWSNFVKDCGDVPNMFSKEKSDINDILIKYGQLIRQHGKVPVSNAWAFAKLKPSLSGIEQSHNLKWREFPKRFLEYALDREEWKDVLSIIPREPVEDSEELKNEECFVYMFLNTKNRLYKLGMSKDAVYRKKTLQSEEPQIKIIAKKKFINRKMAAAFEKMLHELYSHKRNDSYRSSRKSEWFRLDEDEFLEVRATLTDQF